MQFNVLCASLCVCSEFLSNVTATSVDKETRSPRWEKLGLTSLLSNILATVLTDDVPKANHSIHGNHSSPPVSPTLDAVAERVNCSMVEAALAQLI